MNGNILLLGYYLGLLASTNCMFQMPFQYQEVKSPTPEDLQAFQDALDVVNNGSKELADLVTLFSKMDVVRTSYKAYYLNGNDEICFLKWRVWVLGKITIDTSSCVDVKSSEDDIDSGGNNHESARQIRKHFELKNIQDLHLPNVNLIGGRNKGRGGTEIYNIRNSNVTIHGKLHFDYDSGNDIKPETISEITNLDTESKEKKTAHTNRKTGARQLNGIQVPIQNPPFLTNNNYGPIYGEYRENSELLGNTINNNFWRGPKPISYYGGNQNFRPFDQINGGTYAASVGGNQFEGPYDIAGRLRNYRDNRLLNNNYGNFYPFQRTIVPDGARVSPILMPIRKQITYDYHKVVQLPTTM